MDTGNNQSDSSGPMSIGDEIRAARERLGLSQEALAKAVGISQPAIRKIEAGKTQRSRYLSEILRYLEIKETHDKDLLIVAQDHEPIKQADMPRDVSVFGVAVGSDDSEFFFTGEVIDRVRRPPGITGARGVYALYVSNTTMKPRYGEGDLVYVNADRIPAVGDYAVIELLPQNGERSGRGMIKLLTAKSAESMTFEQHFPPAEVTFARSEIKTLHRVLPWNEVLKG